MDTDKSTNVAHMSDYCDDLHPSTVREFDALESFFKAHVKDFDNNLSWEIVKYHGFAQKTEVLYIRLEYNNGSKTLVVENKRFKSFIEACLAGDWAFAYEPNPNKDMVDKGFINQITVFRTQVADGVYIELPRSALGVMDHSELDKFTNGDFITFQTQVDSLRNHINLNVAEATRLSQKLGILTKKKDHDLYLSFKGVDGYTKINISLDRVYPLLPEGGELEINVLGGDCLESWKDHDPIIFKNVRQIVNLGNSVNKKIIRMGELINSDPYFQGLWKEEVKIQLLAASHYMRKIYTFQAQDDIPLLEEVTNEIIRKLTNHGGNIGLDLNEWIVWSYPEDGSVPVKVTDPELQFYENIFHRYTESFTEALYGRLLNVNNPLIRPYQYREVITEDDGIVEGSMRRI